MGYIWHGRGRHKGVRYFSSNATQGGHCPSRATTNSIACVSTAEDRGIVVTCDTASHSDPCATSKETHAESLKGHNNSRSFIMSVDSLGQTATTTNTADLSCPVGKGHEVHPIKLNQVGKLKQCDHVVSEVAHPGVSDGCKIYDINGLDEKYMASILIKTPKKNQWKNSDNELVKAWKRQTDFQFVGPFDQHPCDNGHISPFMTRDKPGSDNRRVIIHLSWPLGGSVNSGIY